MKTQSVTSFAITAAALAVLMMWCAPKVRAQQFPQEQWNEQYRSQYDVPPGKYYTGRSPFMRSAPSVTPAPKAAPAPAAKTTCSDPTWGLIQMNKTMPPEVTLGSEFMSELHLTAQACAANVVVHDTVPPGASYVRSEPAAVVDGSQLTWQVGNLESGESRTIRLWLKPEKEGSLVNCASVSAEPRTCAATRVVNPAIQLTKTAPGDVLVCDPIPMVLEVKNNGSSQLTAVKVSDELPDGLTSDGKSSLSFDAGNLAPGESKQFKFNATAARTGKFVNSAKASCAQGVTADASSTTAVHQPVLSVTCKAPEERFTGRSYDVCYTVVNQGDAPAAGLTLELPVPAGATFKSATAGGQSSGDKVVWNLNSLAANSPQDVCATFVSATAGTFQFNATAKATCAAAASATCQTRVIGVAAILLEKADDPDPVGIGETTTYTVKVTNQGNADDSNISMVVTIAPELAPVSATGNGVIEGQIVTFPVVPRLAAKDAVSYQIVAKGVKVGDGHTVFKLNSDVLKSPISAEESTHVY